MNYTTRCPSVQRISKKTCRWISYQMKLRSITQNAVAVKAGKSRPLVARVLVGKASSVCVYEALADLLGYDTISDLLSAAPDADDVGGIAA